MENDKCEGCKFAEVHGMYVICVLGGECENHEEYKND